MLSLQTNIQIPPAPFEHWKVENFLFLLFLPSLFFSVELIDSSNSTRIKYYFPSSSLTAF